ncbi:hypothetical protein Syun_024837 [Stephania yunnanensis]|uniref:Ubiquitin-like domain-containing protein n=1 Tax=Stephania yunnanensis TaxID=152371 RepID=A0AAP0ETH9_9MAGN
MKILVRRISGPKFPLEIESWETLDELKQKIFQTIGVPPDQQSWLIFAGRKLGDGLIADQIHRIQSTPHRDELLNRFTKNSIESSTTGSGSPLFNILLAICLRGGGNVVFHRPDQSDCDSDDDDDVVHNDNALMSCSNETTMLEEIEMEESTSSTPPMKRRFFSDIADSMLRRGHTRSQLAKLPRLVQDRLFSRARKGNGEPIGCLNNISPNVVEWELGELGNNQSFMRIIQNSGLDNLRHCLYRYVDRTIIDAFAERWHPETNTFQLPFGEMTITLDDVSSILKIPVTGKAVSHLNNIPGIGAKQLLIYLLGVSIDEAEEELNFVGGDSVRLQWLKGKFSEVPNIDDPRSSSSIVYAARAYILYLLGCTLFANKNMTVSVMYLHMLRDVNAIHTFSWGSACLSVLYKQLGTPRPSEAQGYLTLVEAWIYEHIPFLRPHLNLAYTEDLPRVLRWICKPKGTDRSNGKLLRKVRRSLDLLRPNQVVWDPYQEHREQHPFEEVAFYSGYIKCFDAISAYHPERVLRQFGLVQTIPSNPLPPISKRAFQMVFLDQFWERWESHVLSLSARGERVSQPWDVATSSYLHWYGREVRMSGEDLDKLKASLYNAHPNPGNVDCVE